MDIACVLKQYAHTMEQKKIIFHTNINSNWYQIGALLEKKQWKIGIEIRFFPVFSDELMIW